MKDYIANEKSKLILLVAIIAVASLVKWQAGIGIVLGFVFSRIHFEIIKYRYRNLDMETKVQKFFVILGALLGMFVLAFPLLLSFMYPKFVNWIGVLIGLVFEKYWLFVTAILANQDKGVS